MILNTSSKYTLSSNSENAKHIYFIMLKVFHFFQHQEVIVYPTLLSVYFVICTQFKKDVM